MKEVTATGSEGETSQEMREVRDSILDRATEAGLTLSAGDIQWIDGEPYIDGMEADDWLTAMTAD